MPDPIIPQMPIPVISPEQASQQRAGSEPRHMGSAKFEHRDHLQHAQKQDKERHDKAGLRALHYAVEIAKTRPAETTEQTIARAAEFRKFLKKPAE